MRHINRAKSGQSGQSINQNREISQLARDRSGHQKPGLDLTDKRSLACPILPQTHDQIIQYNQLLSFLSVISLLSEKMSFSMNLLTLLAKSSSKIFVSKTFYIDLSTKFSLSAKPSFSTKSSLSVISFCQTRKWLK